MLSFIASPADSTTTKIYAYMARNHHLEADDREFIAGFDSIMEQDRVVVETQRPELIPVDIKEELHLRLPEAASIAYRRLLHELDHTEPSLP